MINPVASVYSDHAKYLLLYDNVMHVIFYVPDYPCKNYYCLFSVLYTIMLCPAGYITLLRS